ncbi:hypothetical protein [Mucilaginibacter xinganensis]|uniref:Uncharacterized protein n=1 Tax=Mucilaginibacter xinganensis TaxID=1234841 RepID=A0A223P1J5_9SPHI|nr:hypothetical protein [Mucilaginibacter xinganensis]ASU35967.1 hypothetical protein MuYL_4082 [Mucilaginibacter xinganensis]
MSRQTIIDVEASQVETKESPAGSNCTKYGDWFGLNGQKWCAIFVSWVYTKALHQLGYIDMPKGYAGYQAGYEHRKKLELLTENPQMGDIVL